MAEKSAGVSIHLKGNEYTFKGGNSDKILLPPSEKGSSLKEKNLRD